MNRVPDLIRTRLTRDRPPTIATLSIPVDVVESMTRIAERRGFSSPEALLRSYLGEGLRREEVDMLREEAGPPGPPQ